MVSLKTPHDAKQARLLFVAYKFDTGYDNSSLTYLYILRQGGILAWRKATARRARRRERILAWKKATQPEHALALLSQMRHDADWQQQPAAARTASNQLRAGRKEARREPDPTRRPGWASQVVRNRLSIRSARRTPTTATAAETVESALQEVPVSVKT